MGISKHIAPASLAFGMLCTCGQVHAQPPAPAPAPILVQPAPPPTLWNFLGIPQAGQRLRDASVNKSGNRPWRERQLPLKRIADPANLQSPNPAIKKAAEIKAEEDLCKQKIKAIKYLGQMGCDKCYGGITEALMDALDDCTEGVRYEAALAIGNAVNNNCGACSKKCCCTPDMMKKLASVAYDKDDEGCFLETSDRVREAACEALMACCPNGMPMAAQPGVIAPVPATIPEREIPMPPEAPAPVPAAETGASTKKAEVPKQTKIQKKQATVAQTTHDQSPSTKLDAVTPAIESAPVKTVKAARAEAARAVAAKAAEVKPVEPTVTESKVAEATTAEASVPATLPNAPAASGTIAWISPKSGTVRLRLSEGAWPEIGRRVQVYRSSANGAKHLGEMEIVRSESKGVMAQPVGGLTLDALAHGDTVLLDAKAQSAERIGSVAWVSPKSGSVRLRLAEESQAEVGQRVEVIHHSSTGIVRVGELEIIRKDDKGILAKPVGDLKLGEISFGDNVQASTRKLEESTVRQVSATK